MYGTVAALCGALALTGHSLAPKTQIRGDYVEARTADVYTGPCFSNAEIFINGDKAVMAWKVTEGSWNGVDLSGLSVAAALKANTTFSQDDPALTRSVVIVDDQARPEQRDALVDMAKHLAGDRLGKVVDVRTSMIGLTVESMPMEKSAHATHAGPQAPRAAFWAPGLAEILTRPLGDGDHVCGNESVAYEPLSKGVEALPAYTLGHSFKAKGLNTTWSDPNCRSSFVGHFAY